MSLTFTVVQISSISGNNLIFTTVRQRQKGWLHWGYLGMQIIDEIASCIFVAFYFKFAPSSVSGHLCDAGVTHFQVIKRSQLLHHCLLPRLSNFQANYISSIAPWQTHATRRWATNLQILIMHNRMLSIAPIKQADQFINTIRSLVSNISAILLSLYF